MQKQLFLEKNSTLIRYYYTHSTRRNRGKKHYLVIVAEGVGGAVDIAKYIETKPKLLRQQFWYIDGADLPPLPTSYGKPFWSHGYSMSH